MWLISAAAFGAAALVALAVLTTGLPSIGHPHPQRTARAATKARSTTPAPAIKKSSSRSAQSPHSSTTTPPAADGQSASSRSTLTAVNAIIDETGAGREKLITAIDAVESCSMQPSDGEAAVGQVVTEREQGLSDLNRLDKVESTPLADRSLIQSLIAVLNDSVQADRAYVAWMADIAGGGVTCGANPMSDANFAAGQAFSTKADSDKQVFVEAWNPLAGQHGLATYQPQDF
ncbi:MAG TPA: hypothetical protein VFZ97_18175 [Acidimicrobiales bacterium]